MSFLSPPRDEHKRCISQAPSIANTAMHITMAIVKPSALSLLLLLLRSWRVVPARLPFEPG